MSLPLAGTPHFHFALGPANYVVSLGYKCELYMDGFICSAA